MTSMRDCKDRDITKAPDLRVAVVQMQQAQGDVDANVQRLRTLLDRHIVAEATPDLLLLPEMWTTGFMTKADTMTTAEIREAYERGVAEMKAVAESRDCAVYGSLIQPVEEDRLSNTGLFVTPYGEPVEYRKRHLFGPGGERKYFVAGSERMQVAWRGWSIRLTTCYDLRFPVWQRQSAVVDEQYDILLNCANWPDLRIDAWEILLKARAIENQCYVLASNRTGAGPKGLKYPGYSFVLGPKGEELQGGKSSAETVLCATIERAMLEEFRAKFPVLEEIDDYMVHNL